MAGCALVHGGQPNSTNANISPQLVAQYLADIFAYAQARGEEDIGILPTEWTVRPMVVRWSGQL